MVSIATSTPKIEFPYTFPTEATPPLLQDYGIPLPVGRMVVEYCLLPRRIIFLGIDRVVTNRIGAATWILHPKTLDAIALSNLEGLIKKASEVADLAIVILITPNIELTTERCKEWLFKKYSFSSLIIDSVTSSPQHSYDHQLIDNWGDKNTHLKINGYVIFSNLEVISIFPKNFVDTIALLSEPNVEYGLKILDESESPGTKKS